MSEAKKLEMLEKYIEELSEDSKSQPIVVEGETDREALRELGIEGEILVLNRGVHMLDFVEEVARSYSGVILLLDWDKKGILLTFQLSRLFLACDVSVNLRYWKKIRDIVSKDAKDVESLPSLIKRILEKTTKNCL